MLSSVLTDTLPGYPLTNDPLLISVFGGIINALGISLCLFAEATSGGTDFIAIFMAERYNRDVWNFIFAGNVVILMTAGCSLAGTRRCIPSFSSSPARRC